MEIAFPFCFVRLAMAITGILLRKIPSERPFLIGISSGGIQTKYRQNRCRRVRLFCLQIQKLSVFCWSIPRRVGLWKRNTTGTIECMDTGGGCGCDNKELYFDVSFCVPRSAFGRKVPALCRGIGRLPLLVDGNRHLRSRMEPRKRCQLCPFTRLDLECGCRMRSFDGGVRT